MENKKKIMYIGILLIITVIVSITYFSYAFLTQTDVQHGKMNIVVGTLEYQLKIDNQETNTVIVPANDTKEVEVKVKSLNTISSKFELYYLNIEDIEIGYTEDNGLPTGTLDENEEVTITVILTNNSSSNKEVTLGIQGSLINNDIELASNMNSIGEYVGCSVPAGTVYNFNYTGGEQTFKVPCNGKYRIETWGAQGGNSTSGGTGGVGAYSIGDINLDKNSMVYVNVGGQGQIAQSANKVYYGGYNGGGPAQFLSSSSDSNRPVGSGGGATHMALVSGKLLNLSEHATDNNILIVSGAGGGANYTSAGGNGGGITGNKGAGSDTTYATGGTQTSGGLDRNSWHGMFGGGSGANYEVGSITDGTFFGGAGAGGGYYGGGRGFYNSATGAGGGSGYIGNSNLTNKKMVCYNCATSTAVNTYTESNTCVNDTATANCSKRGNGYARITYLGDGTAVSGTSWTFDYTGEIDEFFVPASGIYKLETWGAQGGSYDDTYHGGYGGYSVGNINLDNEILSIYVGGVGFNTTGGYNGGGVGKSFTYTDSTFGTRTMIGYGGGGATDIRSGGTSLNNRIIVAGGGGGAGNNPDYYPQYMSIGGSGGGYTGVNGGSRAGDTTKAYGTGGTQTAGGYLSSSSTVGRGQLGIGGSGDSSTTSGSGGGGGYYGGGSGFGTSTSWPFAAGGGSGYIGNTRLTNKKMVCYNCTTSTAAATYTESNTCTNATATANCSKIGNGYAKITYIGNSLVPTMTSPTTPSGQVIFSTEDSGYRAYNVFDNNASTLWSALTKTNAYVGYKFDTPVYITRIGLKPSNTSGYARVKNFIVQASNDNDTWIDLYTGIYDSSTASTLKYYDFDNDNSYLYYRLYVVDNYASASNMYIRIDTLEFYGS